MRGGIIIAEDYRHMPELVGADYAVKRFIKREMHTAVFSSRQIFLIKR